MKFITFIALSISMSAAIKLGNPNIPNDQVQSDAMNDRRIVKGHENLSNGVLKAALSRENETDYKPWPVSSVTTDPLKIVNPFWGNGDIITTSQKK